jgi:hypothetical protein
MMLAMAVLATFASAADHWSAVGAASKNLVLPVCAGLGSFAGVD